MEWNANLNFFLRNPLFGFMQELLSICFLKRFGLLLIFWVIIFWRKNVDLNFLLKWFRVIVSFFWQLYKSYVKDKFLLVIMLIAFFLKTICKHKFLDMFLEIFKYKWSKREYHIIQRTFRCQCHGHCVWLNWCCSGTMQTNSSGAYNFTGLNLPLRIEFTDFDSTDYPAAFGAGNGSNVPILYRLKLKCKFRN